MAQESWNRDPDKTGCQHSEGLIRCVNNCGLFGSPATLNLCSKCYHDIVLKQSEVFPSNVLREKSIIAAFAEKSLVLPTQNEKNSTAMLSDIPIALVDIHRHGEAPTVSSPNEPSEQSIRQHHQHISRSVNRCFSCKKRVGLIGLKCRCGHIFCSLHRYSDKHSCSFDYKAAARDAIAKANPIVKSRKIEKI